MHRVVATVFAAFLLLSLAAAQERNVATEPAVSAAAPNVVSVSGVPRFVRFTGTLAHPPSTPNVRMLFSLYEEREGQTPLFQEAQDVQLDSQGHFTVLLGSTRKDGLPKSLFVDGKAHWLGMQLQPGQGQETLQQPADEEQRVLLVGVPYALKAADADSLGGHPASAFMLAPVQKKGKASTANNGGAQSTSRDESATQNAAISGTGTANYIPLWLNSSTLGNSLLLQHNGNVGIGIMSPASKFEVMSPTPSVTLEGFNSARSGSSVGVLGVVSSRGGVAGVFNNLARGPILSGRSNGAQVFSVDGGGNILARGANLFSDTSTPILNVTQNGTGGGINVSGLFGGISAYSQESDGVLGTTIYGSGVHGIAGQSYTVGVLAEAGDGTALIATNSGSEFPTLDAYMTADPSAGFPAFPVISASSPGGSCVMDNTGSLTCSGTKSAAVKIASGHQVALYAVESPENWFEDFGAAKLASGVASVKLDPAFAQTVNSSLEYHVFLTPNGDCKGLYIARKTSTSFEVHELGGGQSNVSFDYRIVARRRGYENLRLTDVTKKMRVVRARPRSTSKPQSRNVASIH